MPPTPDVIGRSAELARIATAFDAGPLVTLTGLPGIGKTAVAGVFAARDKYAWVRPGHPLDDLPPRVLVDGIDASDHAEVAWVERALDAGSQLLATSRAPLRIARERVVRIGPLRTADPTRPAPELRVVPAVQMFASVAVANGSVARWDDDDVAAVADAVSSVGGHPLAIELLAARSGAFSPTEVRARLLDDGEPSLTWIRGTDDVLAAMTWSVRLVGKTGRSVLEAMVAFAGPVPAEAIAALVDADMVELGDALSELVDVHLVDADHSGDRSVYALPPLVAEVMRYQASGRSAANGEHDERHLGWAVALARRASAGARGETGVPDPLLRAVATDLVAALRRALDADDVDASALLAVALSPVWLAGGVLDWQLELAREAALLVESAGDPGTGAILRGWLVNLMAERIVRADDVDRVVAERDAALSLLSACDEPGDLVHMRVLALVVRAARITPDLAESEQRAVVGLELAHILGDQQSANRFEVWLGMLAHQDGRVDDAIEWGDRAWRNARQSGDEAAMVAAVGLLRTLPAGTVDAALPPLTELCEIAKRCGDLRALTWILPAAAAEVTLTGDLKTGLTMTIESLEIAGNAETWVWQLVPPLATLALIADGAGRGDIAAWTYGVLEAQLPVFRSSFPQAMVERTERGLAEVRGTDGREHRSSFAAGRMETFATAVEGALGAARELAAAFADAQPVSIADALTERELDVLRQLARGGTNKDVARSLDIRPKTVMHHAAAIYRKLGVRGRGEAVARWFDEVRTPDTSRGMRPDAR